MITKRQKQILDFITEYAKKHGFAPSLTETAKHFKLKAASTIHQHIVALEEKGFLRKLGNQPRGIEVAKSESLIQIPLLGTIAAGQPIEAIETLGANISISEKEIARGEKYYALRVRGDSMVNDGILDGDIVVIREQKTADDGQTVVAIIDNNEATLKKIYKEKNRIRLQPANQSILPLFRKEIEIRGVVVKIIRNLESGARDNTLAPQ